MFRLPPAERVLLRARLQTEGLIPLSTAAAILNCHEGQALRWILRGRRGRHLEGYKDKMSGIWVTSAQACARFEGG